MTLTSPAYVISAASHSAQLFREAIGSLIGAAGGITQPQDLAVAQNGTPNMSVNVGAGRCWVPGTSLGTVNPGGGAYYPQGPYFAENDAAVNLPISASNATNPRIDTIICQIQDAFYAGAANTASLAVITGTPTAGATLANLSGAGALPASSLALAYVLVPANATSIVTANIANQAPRTTPSGLISGLTLSQLAAGAVFLNPVVTATNVTAAAGQLVSATAGGITITLPAPTAGTVLGVRSDGSGANPVTVSASSGLIIGTGLSSASFTLGQTGAKAVLVADGTNWLLAAGERDTGWVALTLGTSIGVAPLGYTPAARVRGDIVDLCGGMQNNTGAATTSGTTWFTVPAAGHPNKTVWTPSQSGGAWNLTIGGVGTLNSSVASGGLAWLDGVSYRLV